MRQIIVISSFLLGFTFGALAQQNNSSLHKDPLRELMQSGDRHIHLEADSLLLANYYKLLAKNEKSSGIPGFRIRIYSESGLGAKDKQQRVRARFLSLFPDTDAYYRYDAPFFKVYVGDCRTRSEALKLYEQVRVEFKNPIIVEDNIHLKK